MFAPGLRAASIRAVPRATPMARPATLLSRRTMATKRPLDNEVRRGFDEIIPFLKRECHKVILKALTIGIPVDVYPLVAFVSFVCVLGVFFSAKNLMTDKSLRLKPTTAEAD